MPMYEYACARCGVFETLVGASERETPQGCPSCGAATQRSGVQAFGLGKPAYQCAAVLKSGQKVPGHFGKSARMKKRKSK